MNLSAADGLGNLRIQAASIIRAWLLTGDLEPGKLYTVADFAAKLKVSATPIREALFDLANEGLVEPVKNRGFRVLTLTEHDLDEIFELRMLLEVPAVRKIAQKGLGESAKSLKALIKEGQRYAAEGDLPHFLESDRQFHLSLLELSGNHRLCSIVARLRDQTRLWGLPKLAEVGNLVPSAREHLQLLSALEEGDGEAASETLMHHLQHTRGIWAGKPESVKTVKTKIASRR
ncbi:MAG: GntR family transcriptional regulator [Vulcanimicrobiaceae bacterium]